ncbi:MAG TPA: HAD family hydrolase [Thermoanaerobaculia bacterium]|nr:HAD family hydrolase [Thermoanaerobaculia bacterium]
MKNDVRAVLFDWDGTLVDTADASYRCYVRMFADLGISFDRSHYAETYSPNWHHTYRCMSLPEEKWSEADAAWLRYFAEETPALISGAREALDVVAQRGFRRGIVTSATRARMARELVLLDLAHHFEHVVCGDDGPRRKPDPEALEVCLQRMGIEPAGAMYIGDSPEDIAMARAAGVFAVAVPGSYPNAAALSAAGPDLLARDLADALARLIG